MQTQKRKQFANEFKDWISQFVTSKSDKIGFRKVCKNPQEKLIIIKINIVDN